MAKYRISSPDGATYEVTAPDNATQEQVLAYAQQNHVKKANPAQPQDPVKLGNWQDQLREDFKNQSAGTQALVGAGTALSNLYEGAKQFVNGEDKATLEGNKVFSSEAPVSALAGNLALLAPTALVPGANSVTGAAALGAVIGAINPSEGEIYSDRMKGKVANAALGGAVGGVTQVGANALGKTLLDKATANLILRGQNAGRDAVMDEAVKAGYKITPATSGGGSLSRLLQSVSGKIKTNQAAQLENQRVTNTLARQALGLAENAPLSRETLVALRQAASQSGYEPVKTAGMVQVDDAFRNDLQKIIDNNVTAARDFGAVEGDPVLKLVQDVGGKVLDTGAFDAKSGVAKIQLLRDAADQAYRSGNPTIGKANKQAAGALEGLIERSLEAKGSAGAEMLKNFRDSRKLMAKSFTVENALEGSNVNAARIGARVKAGKPVSDGLATIGKFQQEFKDLAAVPNSGASLPFSPLDAYAGAGTGVLSAIASGNPLALAAGLTVPASRLASRKALLSDFVQKRLATQNYNPSSLAELLDSIASARYLPIATADSAVKAFGQ